MRPLLTAAAVLGAGSLALAPGATIASTSIAITTGGCSGGGTQYCYSPENAAATSGSPVTWTNSSGVAHTITKCTASACPGAPTSTGADSFNVDVSGSSGSFTFSGAGTYVYYCTVHGYAAMHGTVTVSAAAAATPTGSTRAATSGNQNGTPNTGAGGFPLIGVLLLAAGAVLGGAGVRFRRTPRRPR